MRLFLIATGATLAGAVTRAEESQLKIIEKSFLQFEGDAAAIAQAYTAASDQVDLLTSLTWSERMEVHRRISDLLQAKGNAKVRQVVEEFANSASKGLAPKLLAARAKLSTKKIERYSYAREDERQSAQQTIEAIVDQRLHPLTALEREQKARLLAIIDSYRDFSGDELALAEAHTEASKQIELLTGLLESERADGQRQISSLLEAKGNAGVRQVVAEYVNAVSQGLTPKLLEARARLCLKKIERYPYAKEEERQAAQETIKSILDQSLNPLSALEREEKVRLSTIIDTYRDFSGDEIALKGAYTEASSQIDLLTNLPDSTRAEGHRQLSGLLEAKENEAVRQVVAEFASVSKGLAPKLLAARARLCLKKIERYSYANEEERRAAQHTIESILSEGAPELPPVRKHRSASPGLGNFNTADFEKIVIIPDVHGDAEYFIHSLWIAFKNVEPRENSVTFKQFDRALRKAAASVEFPVGRPSVLPESRLSMRGERIALVQLGDIMDRGPQSWLSYKLLASLDHVIGWKKVQLFGNHELMAYVRPGVFDLRYNIEPTDISNDEAMIQFAPGGPLMTYLINNNLLMARFGSPIDSSKEYVVDQSRKADTLFVHAGLDNGWADSFKNAAGIERWEDFIDSINRMKRREFQEEPELVSNFAWEKKSPVYTRTIPEPETGDEFRGRCGELQKILEKLQVSRVIVGHTPEVKNVRRYCNSKFIVSDVAMSRGMGPGAGIPFAMVMSLDGSGSDVAALKYYYGVPGAVNQPPEISTLIEN